MKTAQTEPLALAWAPDQAAFDTTLFATVLTPNRYELLPVVIVFTGAD
jgi:hypothetical protein